jgi:hypothetical protein
VPSVPVSAPAPAAGHTLFRLSGDHSMGDVTMPRLVEAFLTHTGYRNISTMHDDETGIERSVASKMDNAIV